MSLRVLISCFVFLCLHSNASGDILEPFLNSYCVSCHGAEEPKGERSFDQLPASIQDRNTLADYQDILDLLNLAEMPPNDAKQPSDEERKEVVALLTRLIEEYHSQTNDTGSQTVLRRLNAREYRNTIRDLLHLDSPMFDPTLTFPQDQTVHNLDNVGDVQVTSGFLLSQYLDAADAAIEKALFVPDRPTPQKWRFEDGFRQQPEIDQVHRTTSEFQWLTLYDVVGADKHEGAYAPIHAFAEGVPFDGYYKIRFEAQAVNRINPYDPEFLGMDPSEPFRLGIVPGDRKAGQLHKPQPVEPLLAELELADERKWYEVQVWLDEGYTPRFTFRNGLMDVRNLYARVIRQYPDQFPDIRVGGIVSNRFHAIDIGELPQIRIFEVEIEGPFYESWPTPGQQLLLGREAEQILSDGSIPNVRQLLRDFLGRAYRRPVKDEEIESIVRVIESRKDAGRTSLQAYGDGLKAALCSPSFLYFEEDDSLSSYALASRLSYFLWSSMPDETLLNLAAQDDLKNPEILRRQVERMLDDPRSDAFLNGFLDSWLNLRALGSAPPDRGRFASYYHHDLEAAMREETKLFTQYLIEENLDIDHFLDSDFTFVNKPLARHYGIELPEQSGFQKVSLPDRYRGGLLGHASVLTVTANGIDTSPVVRGIWVLENILGKTPSPPPPDVEPLDPDIRGAETIRDQLKKHREVATCFECHRKIDPLGFALENYDPVGRWRDNYYRSSKVDSSGELSDGNKFDDVAEFKTVLLDRREQFARALSERLLSYAIGRELTIHDRPQVDSLTNSATGLRDLIIAVVQSDSFRSK